MSESGSNDEHVTVSVEALRDFVSEKIEEVAARVAESKAQAASFLHELKDDLVSNVQEEIGGFSARAREYADARTEDLLGRARVYAEDKSEELLARAKVYADAQSEVLAEKLGGLFSQLEQISSQIEEVAARADARFASIEAHLDELSSGDSAGAAPEDAVEAAHDSVPGEEAILPGDEADLDLSPLAIAAPADDGAGSDILLADAGDDILGGQEDGDLFAIQPVGIAVADGAVDDIAPL